MNNLFINGFIKKTVNDNDTLVVEHWDGGCFSCCTVKFHNIVMYCKIFNKLPEFIECEKQFSYYKSYDIIQEDEKKQIEKRTSYSNNAIIGKKNYTDITPLLFIIDENVNIYNHCNFNIDLQYYDYRILDYTNITPYIKKYFKLSDEVYKCVDFLEKKYNIDYNKTFSIFFRGNDKQLEINQPSYKEMIDKVRLVSGKEDSDIKFLIQTDEKEFLNECMEEFKNNCIYFNEIPQINKSNSGNILLDVSENKIQILQFFIASLYIISKTNKIFCTSGNCELWIMLFRTNCNNIYQYLNNKEYVYGQKNQKYIIKDNYFLL